jgi:hypothetical protein
MTSRLVSLAAVLLLLGCLTSQSVPQLTADEVTRIADRKARSSRVNLEQYTKSSAKHSLADHGWWVSYSPKKGSKTLNNGFSVLVRDDTREAAIVMP